MDRAPNQSSLPPGSDDGSAVSLTKVKDKVMYFDHEAFAAVLSQERFENHKLAIYAAIGQKRSGKSTFLSFCLRHADRSKIPSNEQSIGIDDKLPQNPFKWRGGDRPFTKGIHISKHPIELTDKNGNKVAVFLMDTQGMFDQDVSKQEQHLMGAITFLISSKQFLHVRTSIEIPHLDLIYDCAKLAEEIRTRDKECRALQQQSLMVVIHDWEMEDYRLGFNGGKKHFENLLNGTEKQAVEHKLRTEYFEKIFGQALCFLLPPPDKVVRKMGHKPKSLLVEEFGEAFVKSMDQLLEYIFDPDRLKSKMIDENAVTCGIFREHLTLHTQRINDWKKLDECAKHVIETKADDKMKLLVEEIQAKFAERFEKEIFEARRREETYNNIFDERLSNAVAAFDGRYKLIVEELHMKDRPRLEELFQENFGEFKAQTEDRMKRLVHELYERFSEDLRKKLYMKIATYDTQVMEIKLVAKGLKDLRPFLARNELMEDSAPRDNYQTIFDEQFLHLMMDFDRRKQWKKDEFVNMHRQKQTNLLHEVFKEEKAHAVSEKEQLFQELFNELAEELGRKLSEARRRDDTEQKFFDKQLSEALAEFDRKRESDVTELVNKHRPTIESSLQETLEEVKVKADEELNETFGELKNRISEKFRSHAFDERRYDGTYQKIFHELHSSTVAMFDSRKELNIQVIVQKQKTALERSLKQILEILKNAFSIEDLFLVSMDEFKAELEEIRPRHRLMYKTEVKKAEERLQERANKFRDEVKDINPCISEQACNHFLRKGNQEIKKVKTQQAQNVAKRVAIGLGVTGAVAVAAFPPLWIVEGTVLTAFAIASGGVAGMAGVGAIGAAIANKIQGKKVVRRDLEMYFESTDERFWKLCMDELPSEVKY